LITIAKTADEISYQAMQTPAQKQVDGLINELSKFDQVSMPLIHKFTPGLYTREIFMPKGTLVISMIHNTEHPFVITKGKVSVWIEGTGVVTYTAPYSGITKPGTRRILYIHEDCSWMTFHPTDKTNPEEIVNDITYDKKRNECESIDLKTIKQLTNNEN